MSYLEELRLILRAVLALAHLLPLYLPAFRRKKERHGFLPLIVYCVLASAWGVAGALTAEESGWLPDGVVRVAGYLNVDLSVLLLGLLVSIAFQNVGRPGHWAWWAVGAAWSLVALGLHVFLWPEAAQTRQVAAVALVGWLIFAGVAIALSAGWALRARLAFYRNRAIYLLMLLIPLLAGHVLARGRGWGVEIGLALHLLGTVGVVFCTTTEELTNVKEVLRNLVGHFVVTVTTALLLLVGLLVGQALFGTWVAWPTILAASAALALALALIHQPLSRLVTGIVNRVLWRRRYDPSQVLHAYGRSISSLLDLDQLAAGALATLGEVLGVRRGALMMITRSTDRVTLRVVGGIESVEEEEITLALDSPILNGLIMAGEPFLQYDLDRRPDLERKTAGEREALRALDMEVFLPILAGERPLGMLALGSPGTGEPYNRREIDFLNTLAQQTGVALQNAHLFTRMKELYGKISDLDEDLRSAYTKLTKMDQTKTDFLSIASHELRTPLTVLQGYTDILGEMAASRDLTPEQTEEIVRNLKTPIERLSTIVTAMLDASTIEVRALDLQFATTTLQAVLSMAIGPWRDAMEERGLQLTMEGIVDVLPIKADLQRLSQAFGNLVSNAVKYTPDGGHIAIEARMVDGEWFEVVVSDTGVGIDPGEHEMVFEKFYRASSVLLHSTGDTKFKGAGPGLGLHIARGVIEAHGGRIWVESEGHDEEKYPGSAFHVLLPLKPAPVGAE
jgi:signal transduction histidine kinase